MMLSMATPIPANPPPQPAPMPASLSYADGTPTNTSSLVKQVRSYSERVWGLWRGGVWFIRASCRSALTKFGGLCEQLEELMGTIEDSFASTEQTLSVSAQSPRTQGKLRTEKDRRQKLLSQLSQVVSQNDQSGSKTTPEEETMRSGGSQEHGEQSRDLGDSITSTEGTTEWKHSTLLRLRKFLRKQYRMRKSKLVDSAARDSGAPEELETDRKQLLQADSPPPSTRARPPPQLDHPHAPLYFWRCWGYSHLFSWVADWQGHQVHRVRDPAAFQPEDGRAAREAQPLPCQPRVRPPRQRGRV
jgi:hypothetical protein